MKIKKIWISSDSGKHTLHILGGIPGIALLMTVLIIGGMFLSFFFDLPRKIFSVILCVAVTALGVFLALRLGQRTVRDVTVFFLTENDRLYAIDARRLSRYGHNITSYVTGTLQTQQLLRHFSKISHIPAGADEILKVEHIRENSTHYVFRCQTGGPDCSPVRRTYFLVKGYPDEESLLQHMERRQNWESTLEPVSCRHRPAVLISCLLLAVFAILCLLSHPVCSRLPHSIYFPCLGGAFLAFFSLIYFVIRCRRGE